MSVETQTDPLEAAKQQGRQIFPDDARLAQLYGKNAFGLKLHPGEVQELETGSQLIRDPSNENLQAQLNTIREQNIFEAKKRQFFIQRSLHLRQALKMHKEYGLWEGRKGTRESWRNVSEHCQTVELRGDEMAEMTGLSDTMRKYLAFATEVHDFHKREDRRIAAELGNNNAAQEEATRRGAEAVVQSGLPQEVLTIMQYAGATANTMLAVQENLLAREQPDELTTACMIMYYADGISMGSDAMQPVYDSPDGPKNIIDRRVEDLIQRYPQSMMEHDDRFPDASLGDAQLRITHAVEARLAHIISNRTGEEIDPLKLPEIIENRLTEKINTVPLDHP